MRRYGLALTIGVWLAGGLLGGTAQAAQCGGDFNGFLAAMSREAAADGISQNVISQALAGVQEDQAVLNFDRRQRGTFRKSFEQYVATRVGAGRIKGGQAMLMRQGSLLSRIEKQFGVPPQIIVAIWGLETDFGKGDMGKLPVFRVLATMAHDCRRTELFQRELLAAFKIVQRGDLRLNDMVGAYAGEIGQTQFLPSSYIKYGVDYRRQRPCRPAPFGAGRAGLDREPVEDQRLEGRRRLSPGVGQFRSHAGMESLRGLSQDHRLFRRQAGRAVASGGMAYRHRRKKKGALEPAASIPSLLCKASSRRLGRSEPHPSR